MPAARSDGHTRPGRGKTRTPPASSRIALTPASPRVPPSASTASAGATLALYAAGGGGKPAISRRTDESADGRAAIGGGRAVPAGGRVRGLHPPRPADRRRPQPPAPDGGATPDGTRPLPDPGPVPRA